MEGDWVKLHRKLLESAVFNDEWLLRLWVWCMLKARFCDLQTPETVIKAGSFMTGRFRAADELNVSPSKWYRGIHALAQLGMITLSACSERTIVTLCNWETYQSIPDVREQPMNSARATSGQQENNERTTSGQRPSTIEECKEGEEGEKKTPKAPKGAKVNEYCETFLRWWDTYPKKSGKELASRSWVKAGKRVRERTMCTSQEAADFLQRKCDEYAKARAGQDQQYTLNPSTWLNQGHYDDDPAVWRKQITIPLGDADPRGTMATAEAYLQEMNRQSQEALNA